MSGKHTPDNDALAEAWDTGHMLGEALAYNALSDLLFAHHGEVVNRREYAEAKAARLATLPHWGTNPHRVIPPAVTEGGAA